MAPGLWDPAVPSWFQPPCVETCRVPLDVREGQDELVECQGLCAVTFDFIWQKAAKTSIYRKHHKTAHLFLVIVHRW